MYPPLQEWQAQMGLPRSFRRLDAEIVLACQTIANDIQVAMTRRRAQGLPGQTSGSAGAEAASDWTSQTSAVPVTFRSCCSTPPQATRLPSADNAVNKMPALVPA